MNRFHDVSKRQNGGPQAHSWWKAALAAAVLAGCFGMANTARAQVVPAANSGG